jgi:DnaJ domain
MREAMALRSAIDLMHVPSRVRIARSEPLPSGLDKLLGIAAGEQTEISAAMASTGRSCDVVKDAAAFFIEQILLHPNADSYRVLGASSDATTAELRRNMALLMRWLHPDADPQGRRSMFASRVTLAWNDLKTAERRAAYDRQNRSSATKVKRVKSRKSSRQTRLAASPGHAHGQSGRLHGKQGFLRRLFTWMGAWA